MVNLDSPVTKGCSGITVMSGRDAVRREASQCIKCAKCVAACPMGLEPYFLSKMTQKKNWDELEARMITSCIECGCGLPAAARLGAPGQADGHGTHPRTCRRGQKVN